MKSALVERAMQILANTLEIVISSNEDVIREETSEWDSIKHLELLLALEEEYDIRFSAEQAANIRGLHHLIQILEDLT